MIQIRYKLTLLLLLGLVIPISILRAVPSLVLSGSDATCFNAANGSLTVQIVGGASNYDYYISKYAYYYFGPYQHIATRFAQSSATATFSPLDTGRYYVLIQDNNGDFAQGTFTIHEPATLAGGTLTLEKSVTCFEDYDAELMAHPTGGDGNYTYQWYYDAPLPPANYVNTGVTTQRYSTAGRGRYYALINDGHGCGPVTSTSFTVFELLPPTGDVPDQTLSVSGTSNPACGAGNQGSISLTGVGGWAGYSYSIINSSLVTTGPQASNSFSNLPADTYQIWVTDTKGCTKQGTNVTVSSTTPATVNAGGDGATCENVAYNLSTSIPIPTQSNTASLSWADGGAGGSFNNAAALLPIYTPSAGFSGNVTLTLTGTGNSPCPSVNDPMTLTITAAPVVDAGSNQETCKNVAFNLALSTTPPSQSNTSSLSWSDGGAGGSFSNATVLQPTYTPPVGFSGSITLTLTGNGNGTCNPVNDAMTLTVTSSPVVDAGSNQETCQNVAFNLALSTTPPSQSNTSSLSWSDGGAGGTFSNSAIIQPTYTPPAGFSGNITLTLTGNGNGSCASVNDAMTLTVTAAPAVDAGSNQETCQNVAFNLALSTTPPSQSNTSSLSWSDGGAGGTFSNATILQPTYTPPAGFSGNITLTLTGNGNGSCASVNDAMTLTVTAAPVVDAGSNQETCQNVAFNLALSTTPPSQSNTSSLSWSDGGAGGSFSNATVLQPTYTPPVGFSGSITLTLTGNGNGTCASVNDAMTLTVTTRPTVDAGSNGETCENTAYNLATSAPVLPSASNTSSLTWSDGGAGGTFSNTHVLQPTYTPPVNFDGVITLTLTGYGNGSCAQASDAMTLTVTNAPIVVAGGDGQTCENVAYNLNTSIPPPTQANTSSFLWNDGGAGGSFSNAAVLRPIYTPPAGFSGSINLTLNGTGQGSCPAAGDFMTLTVIAKPSVSAGGDGATCQGVAYNLSTSVPVPSQSNTSSLSWSDGGAGGTFSNATILQPSYTPPAGFSGNITLTLTGNGNGSCASVNDAMTLTVTAAPAVDAGSNQETCQNVAINLALSTTPPSQSNTSSLSWSDGGAGGTFSNATILQPTYTPPAGFSGNITLTLTGNGNGTCNPATDNMTLTVTPVPTVDAGGNGATCQGVAYNLSTSVPAPSQSNTSSLSWSDGGAGGTFSNATALQPTYTPPAGFSGNITLTLTGNGNGSCASVNDAMTLTVTAAPVVDAGSNQETCQNVAINLALSATPPSQSNTSSLSWSDGGAGGAFSNATLLQPTYTPPAGFSGNITLTLTGNGNGSCAAVNDAMTLTVTAAPVVDAGGNGATCQGVAYNLSTSAPAPSQSNTSSLSWSDGGAGGTFSNSAILQPTYTPPAGFSGSITLTLTGNGNGSCAAVNDAMTLTVTAAPVVDAGGNGATCQGVAYVLSTSVPAPSQSNTSSLSWSDGGVGGTFSNATLLQPTYTPPASFSGNITLTLTGNGNGSCASVNDAMTLTVTAAPVVDAGSNRETCQDVAISLALSATPPSQSNTSSLSWSDGGAGGTFSNATILQPTYSPPAGFSGSITLTLTGTGNGTCNPVNDAMTLTVTPEPMVDAGGNGATCQGVAYNLSTSVPVPSQSNTSSLSWSDGGAGGTFNSASALQPSYTPPAGFSGNITLTLTGNGNGSCASVNDAMTLTVTAAPVVDAGSNQETCQNVAINLALSTTPPSQSNTSSLSWSDGGAGGTFSNATLLQPTYTPPAGFSGSITLTLTGNGNGSCAAVNDAMTLTVTAAPVVDAGGNGETCQGVAYNLSTSVPVPSQSNTSSLSWSDGGAGGTFSNSAILQPTYTPPAGFSGNITLTLTGNGNGSCASVNDAMTLTVTAAPVVDAGSNEETCQNMAIDLTLSATPPSQSNTSSISWSDGGAGGTFSNATILQPTYSPPAGFSGNITLTLTGNGNGSCNPATDNMTLSVTPPPIIDAGSNQETCQNVAFNLANSTTRPSQSNTSFLSWSDGAAGGTFSNPNVLLPTYTPPAGFTGTIILTLAGNGNGSCLPTNDFMRLTVTPEPIVNAGGNGETCQGVTYDLSTSAPAPSQSNTSSLNWSDGGAGGTFSNATILQPTYTPPAGFSGNITLTLTGNGNGSCAAVNDAMTLTVTAAPVVNAGSNQETCQDVAINLAFSATPPSQSNTSSLNWSDGGAGGSFSNATVLQPTYTPPAGFSGNITLTLTGNGNGSCASANDAMTLTVTAAPVVDAGSNGATCQGVAYNLSYSAPAPSQSNTSSLNWSDGGTGGTFSNATILQPTYTPPAGFSGNITLTLTGNGNGSCASVNDAMTLTVTAAPVVDAGSNEETCQDVAIDLTLSTTPPSQSNTSSLSWSDGGAGGTFSNATILQPTYTPPAGFSGSITLTLTGTGNGSCASANDAMTLTVTAAPTVNAGGDGETCQGVAYNLSTSAPAPTQSNTSSLNWSDGGTGGTFSNATILQPTYTPPAGFSGNITLTLTGNGNGSCASVNDAMTLTVTAAPVVDAGTNEETCQDVAIDLSLSTTAPSQSNTSSFSWSDGGAGGTFSNATILQPTYTPPAGFSGSITLTLTGNGNGSCTSVNDAMILTVTPGPAVDAGSDGETCMDQAYDLAGSSPNTNHTSILTWDDGGAGGAFDDASTLEPLYTPPLGYTGTITLTLTGNGNGSCLPVSDALTLTVFTPPSVNAGGNGEVCEDGTYALLSSFPAPSEFNAASISWNDGGVGGTFSNPNILLPTYTPPAGYSGLVTLTLTGTGNSTCPPVSDAMTLTVTAKPSVNAGADITLCYGDTVYLTGTASDYLTTQWSTGSGDGLFDDEFALQTFYTPGFGDLSGGTVTLTLRANGMGSCADATDNLDVTIPPQLIATIGAPTPFLIAASTQIEVRIGVSEHELIQDLSFYLQDPDGVRIALYESDGGFACNWNDSADVTFTNNPTDPLLNACVVPPFPGSPVTGTYQSANVFNPIFGKDPANGAWSIVVTDNDPFTVDPTVGYLSAARIAFTDISTITGLSETVEYRSDELRVPINEYTVANAQTVYTAPIGLRTSCWNTCDAMAQVTVAGGTPPYNTYTWSPLPDAGNGRDTVLLCQGTYFLTVTDNLGCQSTTSVVVSSPDSITITQVNVTDSIDCYGGMDGSIAIEATGGTGPISYTLLPGTPSEAPGSGLFTGLTAGTYTIRIEDGSSCAKDTVISIRQPAELLLTSATVTNAVYCAGDTNGIIQATAGGGTAPYTFILEQIAGASVSNTTGLFVNLQPGSYRMRLTDSHSCDTMDSDTLIIGIPIPLTIDTVLNEAILCNGSSAPIGVVVNGGNPDYMVVFNTTDTLRLTDVYPGVPDTLMVDLPHGDYNIEVVDSRGCYEAWPVTIVHHEPAAITIDSLEIVDIASTGCYYDTDGAITIHASGGAGTLFFAVDTFSYRADSVFTGLSAGTHSVRVRDANQCEVSMVAVIDGPPELRIISVEIIDIDGIIPGSITINAGGGTPYPTPNAYEYSFDGGLSFGTSNTLTGITDTGSYHLMVRDANLCIAEMEVDVRFRVLDIRFSVHDALCFDPVNLAPGDPRVGSWRFYYDATATAPFTFWWNSQNAITINPAPGEDHFELSPAPAGDYALHIQDANGRFIDTTITVGSPPQLYIRQKNSSEITCREYNLDGTPGSNGYINIRTDGGVGGYTYDWTDIASNDSIRENLTEGTYVVTIRDANACEIYDTTQLISLDTLDASLTLALRRDDNTYASTPSNLATLCYGSKWTATGDYNMSMDVDITWEPETLFEDNNSFQRNFTATEPVTIRFQVANERCMDYEERILEVYDTVGMQITATVYRIADTVFNQVNTGLELGSSEGFIDYLWQARDDFSAENTQTTILTTTEDQMIVVRGTTPDGCYERDTLYLRIRRPIGNYFEVFTPNNDGHNDTWVIPNAAQYPDLEVVIFNRWGQQVYYSSPYGTDENHFFKGISQKNGKELPIGSYYFIITPNDNEQEPVSGTVTIVR